MITLKWYDYWQNQAINIPINKAKSVLNSQIIRGPLMRSIFLSLIIAGCFVRTQSQYINPPFSGSVSDGSGTVGSLGSNYSDGYLNPAGCFTDYPRLNISSYTGTYSDWLLYLPTLKNISIRYPIIINKLSCSFSYSTPQDNHLKYSPSRDIFNMGNDVNAYIRREISFDLAYHPSINKVIHNFDIYLGGKISRYWGEYISFPVDDFYGEGFYLRMGTYMNYHLFPRWAVQISGIVQPNSVYYSFTQPYPGFYGSASGITYYFDLENNEFINISAEILMPLWNESKISKLSAGLKYHFPTLRNNTIQCGVFSYSVDPYHQYLPVYWTTVGVSYEFKYIAFSIAMMDAINLGTAYREKNDTGKIFSLSLDIPIKLRFAKNISFGHRKQPVFKYFKYRPKEIKVGESDLINVYVQNEGNDTLKSSQIFINILPQNGVYLPKRIIDIGNLSAGEIKKIAIPIEAVKGYLTQDYLLKAECFYRPDASNTIEIPMKTIEPVLNVSLKMKPFKQLLVGHIPGIFLITVNIHNSGNMTAKNVGVIFSDELVKQGILNETHKVIDEIQPGATKSVGFSLEFQDTLKVSSVPINITFEEENGYVPEPYYTSIQLMNRGTLDGQLIQIDKFTNGFKNIKEYFIVLEGTLKDLEKLTYFNIQCNNRFQGKLVIGPYSSFDEAYNNHMTVTQLNQSAEIYGVKNSKIERIDRYFLSIEKSDVNIEKLTDLEIVSIYQSTLDSGVLLIGPFKSLLGIRPLLSFFERNFKHVVVQKQFPNEVKLYQQD